MNGIYADITMELERWRQQMVMGLTNVLRIACSQYSGIKKDQIQALLKCGDVLQAYFILTQTSQNLANVTKADFFLELRKLVGVIAKNSVSDDMNGMEVTQRTGTWRKTLALLVPWWTEEKNLDEMMSSKYTFTADHQEGTVRYPAQFSFLPLEIGTYIHAAFGESITAQCAKMFEWNELKYVVPGRMVHAGLPWIGVTPDAICVVDEKAFHFVSHKLLMGEAVCAIERGAGAPWITIEIKTIHGPRGDDGEEAATIREEEINQLLSVFENDNDPGKQTTKDATLKLLVKKLEVARWMPRNLYAEDNDYMLEENEVKLKRTVNSKKRKTCAFFKKSTIFYPTKQFKNLRVEDVGGEVYPNLAKLSSETFHIRDEPPTKKRAGHSWHHTVPIKKMIKPGKACIIVYAIGKTVINQMLFHLTLDEAPLMLTLNSDHFNQVMGQHATARQFNEDVKSVFAVTFRSYRNPSCQFGIDPVQLAIVYAYDVGIQADAVDAYSDVIAREIALAAQGVENSESLHEMLLRETSLAERTQTLYRRASAFGQLAEPTNGVLNVYRKAFNDLCEEDLNALEEWNADDIY